MIAFSGAQIQTRVNVALASMCRRQKRTDASHPVAELFDLSVCVCANVSTVVGCNWQPQFVNAPFWKDCEEDCVFFRAAKLF